MIVPPAVRPARRGCGQGVPGLWQALLHGEGMVGEGGGSAKGEVALREGGRPEASHLPPPPPPGVLGGRAQVGATGGPGLMALAVLGTLEELRYGCTILVRLSGSTSTC